MIRTVLIPENTDVHISIPKNYVGRRMEVLMYATDELIEEQPAKNVTMAQFWGVISQETGDGIQENAAKSRNEWDQDI